VQWGDNSNMTPSTGGTTPKGAAVICQKESGEAYAWSMENPASRVSTGKAWTTPPTWSPQADGLICHVPLKSLLPKSRLTVVVHTPWRRATKASRRSCAASGEEERRRHGPPPWWDPPWSMPRPSPLRNCRIGSGDRESLRAPPRPDRPDGRPAVTAATAAARRLEPAGPAAGAAGGRSRHHAATLKVGDREEASGWSPSIPSYPAGDACRGCHVRRTAVAFVVPPPPHLDRC
jgi:hypothetical protein